MDKQYARNTLSQLAAYTRDCSDYHGIAYEQGGKNNYGSFKSGAPYGAITHFTASNSGVTETRPFGRDPVLRARFARNSPARVGVQFVVLDRLNDKYRHLREKYGLLRDLPAEVMFFGDDLTFWHAGWVNQWCYGIEVRNIGRLERRQGVYRWSHGKYNGRPPILIGDSWWEPYTRRQMAATLWIHRLMATLHPIRPQWFLGHVHVSSTRSDPGKHFPLHEMRYYALEEPDLPLDQVPFLDEFLDDPTPYGDRADPLVSEAAVQEGYYREDWDGCPAADELEPEPIERFEPGDVTAAKKMLRLLGYYPGPRPADGEETDEVNAGYTETVLAFRGRWKVRRRGGRGWVQKIPLRGGMDEAASELLVQMTRWWGRL